MLYSFRKVLQKVTCVFKAFVPQICMMFPFTIRNPHSCCATNCICYGIKEGDSVVAPCGMISISFRKNRHVVLQATAGDKYAKALKPCFP
jgi:hypothetical protein